MNTVKGKILLRAFCVWTVFVWLVLIKNMLTDKDHSIAFRGIHIGLAVISIAFAATVWPLAKRIHVSPRDPSS